MVIIQLALLPTSTTCSERSGFYKIILQIEKLFSVPEVHSLKCLVGEIKMCLPEQLCPLRFADYVRQIVML